VNLSAIDLTGNDTSKYLVTNAELIALRKEAPKEMRLTLYKSDASGQGERMQRNAMNFVVGQKYYALGIQLMNLNKMPVVSQPQQIRSGGHPTKYKVSLVIEGPISDDDRDADKVDFGTTDLLWEWSPAEKKYKTCTTIPKDKSGFEKLFFGFKDVSLRVAGNYKMLVQVWDGQREVLKKEFTAQVRVEQNETRVLINLR
jgi:hypothetical protein